MNLRKKTISGVAWNGIGNLARQGLQILSLIIMTRFLSPEDFGVYAILMIFITFMQIFASMGTSQIIIHLDDPDQEMLSSIFFFNLCIGIFLFFIMYIAAWPIALFFEKTSLIKLLRINGFSFILTTVSLVQKALLEKQLYFKKVVSVETISFTAASIAGILSAISGLGVYSLIIHSLCNTTMLSVGLWLSSPWRPSRVCKWSNIKEILGYSINLTGFSTINYFARNADTFVIGRFLGASSLGVYNVAYKIMLYPLDNISRVIVRVLFPVFSSVKNDNQRFKTGYIKAITLISLITFPLMSGLFAVSNNFVELVFGNKWVGMAGLLMIFAPIGIIQSIVTTVGSIYTAKGTTSLMLRIGSVNAIMAVVSFIIGIPFGVNGVALSFLIANIIMLYPNLKYAWNQIGISFFEGLNELFPYFFMAINMAIAVVIVGELMTTGGFQKIWILITQILFGVVVYITLIFCFYRDKTLALLSMFK